MQAWNKNPVDTHDFALNATKVAGTHSMRFGGGYRIYRRNSTNLGNSSGVLSFGTNWTRGPLDTSAASPIGQGMASLLYGLANRRQFPDRRELRRTGEDFRLLFPGRLAGEPQAHPELGTAL